MKKEGGANHCQLYKFGSFCCVQHPKGQSESEGDFQDYGWIQDCDSKAAIWLDKVDKEIVGQIKKRIPISLAIIIFIAL